MNVKKRIAIIAGVGLLVLALGGLGAAAVFAQEPEPPDAEFTEGPRAGLAMPGMGMPGQSGPMGGGRWEQFDILAEALDMTPTELFEALHSGQTLAEIAEAQGVDLEDVRESMKEARLEAQRERIEQAVEDGKISQERADWMLEGLENGWLPRRGPRRGRPAGPRGRLGGAPEGDLPAPPAEGGI
jgi:hypothetical protein